jgi:AcrR family transcriptional regulator
MAKVSARSPADARSRSDAKSASKPERAIDRIRKTARELFYRDGIRAVGVDEIVSQSGVTKPSLYRSFPSKDELAASYLKDYEQEFWLRFEEATGAHPGRPREQILAFFERLATRATQPHYRGCGLTNAVVEFPERDHPARRVAEAHKRELRRRLEAMAVEMGVRAPDRLADGLLLLIEGAYASGQLFGADGPARSVAIAAKHLIDAAQARR